MLDTYDFIEMDLCTFMDESGYELDFDSYVDGMLVDTNEEF